MPLAHTRYTRSMSTKTLSLLIDLIENLIDFHPEATYPFLPSGNSGNGSFTEGTRSVTWGTKERECHLHTHIPIIVNEQEGVVAALHSVRDRCSVVNGVRRPHPEGAGDGAHGRHQPIDHDEPVDARHLKVQVE